MVGTGFRRTAVWCLLGVMAWSGRAVAAPEPAPPPRAVVQPGKVKWHPSFAAACRAAEGSGKPVLLFHLLGRLDEGFT